MRFTGLIYMLLMSVLLAACSNSNQINGKSMKTAHKSVAFIKERLPLNQRVEFEVAYWSLRNKLSNDAEFLNSIDHKTATDIIDLAKAHFAKDKADGAKQLAHYENWGQMIARQIEQRGEQDQTAADPKDKKGYPRVDYKMHAM
jgi:hypothetical protein